MTPRESPSKDAQPSNGRQKPHHTPSVSSCSARGRGKSAREYEVELDHADESHLVRGYN
jgi:hypothetical protein